jgi:hypothetical protein
MAMQAKKVNIRDACRGVLLFVNFEAKRGKRIATRNEAKPNGNKISSIKCLYCEKLTGGII